MDKPFLSYSEQIDKLRSKHLVIADEEYAISVLKQYGYYSLICGYKSPFKNKTTNNYNDGTKFEEILQLFLFDSELREVFLKYLLLTEQHIKECLSNHFCETYGETQNAYLDANNYDYFTSQNIADINKLINKLSKLTNSNEYPFIKHARTFHGNVPLWVLFRAVTFGSVSKMYQLQKQTVKASIAQDYPFLNEGNLGSLLQIASACRNVCAHAERLYTFRHKKAIPMLPIHDKLHIPKNVSGNEYEYGQKDLFAVLISLRYLLSTNDFKALKALLAKTIRKFTTMVSAPDSHITPKQILTEMGFPSNWERITRYRAL